MAVIEKQRVSYIDLVKGVCILMVVLMHTGVTPQNVLFSMLRMPLYFVLSGLFFKGYGGLVDLALKKINRLIVPFLFYHLVGCVFCVCFFYFFLHQSPEKIRFGFFEFIFSMLVFERA